MDPTFLLFLLFPTAALLAGAFLLIRGYLKLQLVPAITSGPVSSPGKMKEPLSGQPCAYYRLVLECYRGGASPWRTLASMEGRADLMVGKTLIRPDFADFQLKARVTEGFVRREPGLLEEMRTMYPLRLAKGILRASPFSHDPFEERFLEDSFVTVLKGLDPLKKKLADNIRRPLRITEYVLPEGAKAFVSGGKSAGGILSGELENRLIITDSDEGDIRSAVRDRAAASIAAGAFLLVLSALLYYVIAASA